MKSALRSTKSSIRLAMKFPSRVRLLGALRNSFPHSFVMTQHASGMGPTSIFARNKPADGGGHVNQKGGAAGAKAAAGAAGVKGGAAGKTAGGGGGGGGGAKAGAGGQKPPTAQKGQVKAAPSKAAAAKGPAGKKNKKGQRHQQHDLIVTIDLVSARTDDYFDFFSIPRH
ncbi:hypothetical protein J437_LFUL012882 [Ladona fulva]|uniref:Uncharacterized protein n=1 Tax=Ladona fulva TaxID=123851 RepID=A0A8K0NZM0_LADFU|nr:hypothetical protein J437_LFUL012882 [Ladona fulva]